ncbi:MAG: hypothetical protein FWE36_04745 [Erysipelotrichales bacterium]|nr:hypothetical protein [Erysipelotrichales bacterium]
MIKEYKPNYFILRPEGAKLVLLYRGKKAPLVVRDNKIIMQLQEKDTEYKAVFVQTATSAIPRFRFTVSDEFSDLFLEQGNYTNGGIVNQEGDWRIEVSNQLTRTLSVTLEPSTHLWQRASAGRIKTLLPLRIFNNAQRKVEITRIHVDLEFIFLQTGVDD